MKARKNSFYCRHIKRVIDVIIALLVFILFGWLFILLALLVRINLGSPVFFKQERVGRGEKEFIMYKFRTMNDEVDEHGNLLPDEKRLTKFGGFLRSTSLDELPEFWNVFAGSMSLIGPRPLLIRYIPYYTEFEHHRHDVLPGITGYAQVNGRNYVSWEDKFRMDVEYTQNVSLKTDMSILIKTVSIVFYRNNIDTGSFIEKDGVIYRPLDIEREEEKVSL